MKKILQVLIVVALFFPLFSSPVPVKAEVELQEKITIVTGARVSLGNGFYTRQCKFKFMVSRNGGDTWYRRATVKIKTKARWVDGYGVKINWVNTFWWHDYWPDDGYDLDLLHDNHDTFPSSFGTYWATFQSVSYVLYPGWVFSTEVNEDDVGWIYCKAIAPLVE